MTMTRRDLLKGAGAFLATSAFGLESAPRRAPHYMVLVVLRGGYDPVWSVDPKDPRIVGDKVHCGYRAEERIQGAKRLFGPLIGGLERHDSDLCLVHGVRSDTTAHPDGLAMLARGSVRARSGRFVDHLAGRLEGDAPMPVLDLASLDGRLLFDATERPRWAELRTRVHLEQVQGLGADEASTRMLSATLDQTAHLRRFLDEARRDAPSLSSRFRGDLAGHFRLALQAIRGNWARVVEIGARSLWFDSHSDHDRFQRERQPGTFADLATFLDLLKSERNAFGPLIEQTTVAVFSEFGRFPRLNGESGKDHWPENSWILVGKGVRRGVTIGGTDAVGKGLPVDYRTGEPRARGGRPLFIDNTFATLLRIARDDPNDTRYERDAPVEAILSTVS
jgi:hypothetical protein